MQLQSLYWEEPLEGMETHSSILAWRISRTEEAFGAAVYRIAESEVTEVTLVYMHACII